MAEHTSLDGRVHHAILARVIESGRAPEAPELAASLAVALEEVEASLGRLAENHGVVLHPGSASVWVIHPFALWPTNFWVSSRRGGWWGNCAWCSLGIAALLAEDATISTTLGAEREPVEIHVRGGEVVETGLAVHFSRPVRRVWDNVLYYCGTVLAFRSAPEVDRWCERHGIERGAVVPIAQVWDLARAWYGRHLDPDWRKWTPAEAQEIFDRVGLTGDFWRVPQGSGRF